MAKPIRVPQTTVTFIVALNRILHQELRLNVTRPECWTFTQRNSWEECTRPSDCNMHHPTDETRMRFAEAFDYTAAAKTGCYEIRHSPYDGAGNLDVGDRRVEVRLYIDCRAQLINSAEFMVDVPKFEMIRYTVIKMWLQDADGNVTTHVFRINEDGTVAPRDEPIWDLPRKRNGFSVRSDA